MIENVRVQESCYLKIKKKQHNFREVIFGKDVLEMVKEISHLWLLYCCRVLRASLTNMARQI